ncbi:MAG: Eco47II family restriction endonuclease [Anaerolineaceae bacterium]|nr:Eco47II family restriction endonuclease [Anaerolineaceae bacterium]
MPDRTYLSWIDDDALMNAVMKVYTSVSDAFASTSLKYLERNIIDPFSLIFETALTETTMEEWLKIEAQRQAQKKLSNTIGEFHQNILGSCQGWENLGTGHESGVDLRKVDGSIYAEIKNKYNTIKGSSKIDALQYLISLANWHKKSTIYMVWIIMDKTDFAEEQWIVSEVSHQRVKLISGDHFYSLVTGVDNALQQLHSTLPNVIKAIIDEHGAIKSTDIQAIADLHKHTADGSLKNAYDYFFKSAFRKSNQ